MTLNLFDMYQLPALHQLKEESSRLRTKTSWRDVLGRILKLGGGDVPRVNRLATVFTYRAICEVLYQTPFRTPHTEDSSTESTFQRSRRKRTTRDYLCSLVLHRSPRFQGGVGRSGAARRSDHITKRSFSVRRERDD